MLDVFLSDFLGAGLFKSEGAFDSEVVVFAWFYWSLLVMLLFSNEFVSGHEFSTFVYS